MDRCIVGDRVQIIDYETNGVRDGVVVNVIPAKASKPQKYWEATEEERLAFTTFADVKWDDGTESQHDIEDLEQEDSEIERDFRKALHYAEEEIQAKLDEAHAALREATKIAERYGVPFRSSISPISNQYFPRSFEDKFGELDKDFVRSVSETYNEYESTGWKHSAIC